MATENKNQGEIRINSYKDIPKFLDRDIFTFEGKVYFHSKTEKGNYPLGCLVHWEKISDEPELYDCWVPKEEK